MPRRCLAVLALLPALSGGCVAYDIRDQLVAANTSFGELKRSREQLEETNRQLTEVNHRLEDSAARLASVEQRMIAMENNLAYISSAIDTVDRAVPIVKVPKPPVEGTATQTTPRQ